MKYHIGDRIVYPFHGAGVVADIETCEVLGEKRDYYVLSFPHSNLKLNVPTDNAEQLGIRDLISLEEVEKVFEHLSDVVNTGNANWNKRHRENIDKLRSGSLYDVAEVYKYLRLREAKRNLSTGEKKLLSGARNALVSEVSFVTGEDEKAVNERLDGIFADIQKKLEE